MSGQARTESPATRSGVVGVRLTLCSGFAVGLLSADAAVAACALSPTAGNDIYVCSSATFIGTLTDPAGSNTLRFPLAGTGNITGAVVFGLGADKVDLRSGEIGGDLSTGGADDTVLIDGGTVIGDVLQGEGMDFFRMTDGSIGALAQGDNLDMFVMSGGRIVGAFEDGDMATLSGGRIGRVDMKLDDNFFDMSGGEIDNNLVAGFGNDTILLSGGRIGGNISVSGGEDRVEVTGGEVVGEIRLSFGLDTFMWQNGGTVAGLINLAEDNDTATLLNLGDANLSSTARIDGGTGTDGLTLAAVTASELSRFTGWETVGIADGSRLTLDGAWLLGDAGTGTGDLMLDGSSTLDVVGSGQLGAIDPSRAVEVVSAGTIDLTGGLAATDRLTIAGNLRGEGGRVRLDTVLEADGSPSDRLIVSGGSATGRTLIEVVNAGGDGELTLGDGIKVVEAKAGGSTAPDAFALAARVAAGPYEYLLLRGASAYTDDWFLRSSLLLTPTPSLPGPGITVPIYRPEVAAYSVVPPLAGRLALDTLGTFHDRRGDQTLLAASGPAGQGWARLFGGTDDFSWSGEASPSFDGRHVGLQAGYDVVAWTNAQGFGTRAGFLLGWAEASGDTSGRALGGLTRTTGTTEMTGKSLGFYLTQVRAGGVYVDSNLMATWLDGHVRSDEGQSIQTDGTILTASVEAGIALEMAPGLLTEPQAQLVWQSLSLDSAADDFSNVTFDTEDSVSARLGLRLESEARGAGRTRAFVQLDLWQTLSGTQAISFDRVAIRTETGGTSVEIGAGLVSGFSKGANLTAGFAYATDLDGADLRALRGNLGVSITW